jgi:hypothetical protein
MFNVRLSFSVALRAFFKEAARSATENEHCLLNIEQ